MANTDQRLTTVEWKIEKLTQRLDNYQFHNGLFLNNSFDNLQINNHGKLPPINYLQAPSQLLSASQQHPSGVNNLSMPVMEANAPMGWSGRARCMLCFAFCLLLGGIGMLISGAILLDINTSTTYCTSPYSYSTKNKGCCYLSTQSCYPQSQQKSTNRLITGSVLLSVGIVSGIIGIILFVKAKQIYLNNNATCCC